MFLPPFLSGRASNSRIGEDSGFCPVMLGINFSRNIVSLFSKASVRMGVVRDRNVSLCCTLLSKRGMHFGAIFCMNSTFVQQCRILSCIFN